MLILAHADALGVDLHQLGQGVLEAAGDGHRRAQVHVKVGELLGGQLGGGVHRGPRLVDHHIGDAAVELPNHLHRHLLGLPAGGAVANGDVLHVVLLHQGGELGNGLLLAPLPVGGIDHGGVQHLARGVDDCHLAPHAVAGIQAHGHMALHRGLHQQGLEV